ncbi:VOC family protein [Zavarzinia compransoris]|uniref:Glyoxalase/bleomycin resistance/extradiol dioxygenase family protein n=1 Tax=Zavarzinia compransoris TaxID=1264899 RepID=A0A317E483_9PROT|nr:VOC family protein [Zavarzinia compransoris]PWR20966.1 glyoxalase/bleomycin resistance/extradiol dioxygenase family protein [Zavarzinia compransoris]TDP43994.1 2,3-dihydroxy-p-cumate/2,3-dihydroxybenzoate 3,4-dioxygenase [Zavarzinia compransoris]
MIRLDDITYVRLGTPDLALAEDFATRILGLEVTGRTAKALYLRSDARAHTLCYVEGDPADQTAAFEVADGAELQAAAAALEALGHRVAAGTAAGADARKVMDFIAFRDPSGNRIELVVKPEYRGPRYFGTRDAAITGFNHIGLNSTDPLRDEAFWTRVCNARVSDRIGDIPLMRINAIHHTIALVRAAGPGIQHINHQVVERGDVLRNYHLLRRHNVPIVFGPGRHPTSGANFIYFRGPDGMVFEYSCGVDEIADEAGHRPRSFAFEPASLCLWGAKPGGLIKGA